MPLDSKLVYSTDPGHNKRCSRCKELIAVCRCKGIAQIIDLSKITALVRIEKKHRGGKEVTIIERLPPSETFLKELSQQLKRKCGSGGTYKIAEDSGVVEIQGDKREQVKNELTKQGIKCR